MIWLRVLLVVACFGVPALVACSDDDEKVFGPGPGLPPDEMVGTWIYSSARVGGGPAELDVLQDWVAGTIESRILIEEDRSFLYEEVDVNQTALDWESGFVFVDDDRVDINTTFDDSLGTVAKTRSYVFKIQSDSLTLDSASGSPTFRYVLTKRD